MKQHWIYLLLSLLVLGLSYLLRVSGEHHVAVPQLRDITLPGLCTSQAFLGVPCPGCGMTRCFISLAHGQLSRAWHFNPAGILVFAFVLCQIPYRTTQIWRIHRGKAALDLGNLNWFLVVLAIVLIVQWIPKAVSVLF